MKYNIRKSLGLVAVLVLALCLCAIGAANGEAVADAPQSASIDWTELVVAVIGVVGTVISGLLARVWMTYVKPWLEQHKLTEAANIVVGAVEALLGRYCGPEKWQLALEKMAERGFYTDSQQVIDALKAAWKKLDLEQVAAGEKEKPLGVG